VASTPGGGALHGPEAHKLHTCSFLFGRTVVTVRRLGLHAIALALALLPELAYSWWVQAATVAGVYRYLSGGDGRW
jgi:hypothetical protein